VQGGAATIASSPDAAWALPIGALVLGLRQVGLSGFDPGECMALEHELTTWQRLGNLLDRENALR
jgi:phosphoglucan,water dikinase